MILEILKDIQPTQLYVYVTGLLVIFLFGLRTTLQKISGIIVLVNCLTEIAATILLYNGKGIGLLYTFSVIVHNGLWLLLLSKVITRTLLFKLVFSFFFGFSFINLTLGEGAEIFNYNTFVMGAFLYLVLFIYESFYRLQREDFEFFFSNNFVIITAPILFFFGLSFVFGFRSGQLGNTLLFGEISLYKFIIIVVNFIYYSLINLYFYREKKYAHAH